MQKKNLLIAPCIKKAPLTMLKNEKKKKKTFKDRKEINCTLFPFLYPNISMHILHTVLYTFPKVLTRRICLTIKCFFTWWSLPFFLQTWFRGDIREKLEARHLQQVKGLKINVLSFYMKTLFVSHQWKATSVFNSLVSN